VDASHRYIHGYATEEQERLIEQALHWRDDLILPGTSPAPGTRLLEIGCGVGAVLGVLGQAFPGVVLSGIDIAPEQIDTARAHLAALDVVANLRVGDGADLPYPDGSFDHVWTMWFLEHLPDPMPALREAYRVLAPGGAMTAIETNYWSVRATPSIPVVDDLFAAMAAGMAAGGHADAGSRLRGWLEQAGFTEIWPGEHHLRYEGEEAERQTTYVSAAVELTIPALAAMSGAPAEAELRRGLEELRELAARPGAGIEWTIYKATARRQG
jgi:ubiquinone/menaquinone biosynthesis C-methylase UbiE